MLCFAMVCYAVICDISLCLVMLRYAIFLMLLRRECPVWSIKPYIMSVSQSLLMFMSLKDLMIPRFIIWQILLVD